MELGWHEWPLMLFTVLGQCAVGGFIVLALALLCGKTDERQRKSIHRGMFFIWVLMGIAFLASVMHLGTMSRAFNSLNRIGESGLSNEIAFGSIFFAIGGIYWLVAILGKMPKALGKVWLVIAMIAGVAFVYAMCRVYQIETVPTWDNGYTTLNFFLTMLIGGSLLGSILKNSDGDCRGKGLAAIGVIALIISACSGLMQGSELASLHSSVTSATVLVPQYGQLMTLRLVMVAAGLSLWIVPMLSEKRAGTAVMMLGFVLVVCGELIGRAVFYNLHMTVGVTFGG
ncbi:DmsC/YnfH family molybdoenzyme membrane anchor subunit [Pragia fontium]|uniref:Anaerobic dimethyl sulfoxide reductase subunit C (DMSO reductase anchor subunit) n=1 Tax=Pragia fontium DSM 5563 = ATCC 49100 TaxID=1122977 RepID=A0AAJ5BHZ4_9GAMM|nr:DmsC/YnfH family molybdoenzyme membrane anchor subunit [Pragia fontium]SFD14008.1 anaerobic dimethyl sulfoxide reductase subunit C (DMSO reductase anchor subunit) [Pragia fontium DSM 5563 = ATCC 49100]